MLSYSRLRTGSHSRDYPVNTKPTQGGLQV